MTTVEGIYNVSDDDGNNYSIEPVSPVDFLVEDYDNDSAISPIDFDTETRAVSTPPIASNTYIPIDPAYMREDYYLYNGGWTSTLLDMSVPRPSTSIERPARRNPSSTSFQAAKAAFYGETTNGSVYNWKQPLLLPRRYTGKDELRSDVPFFGETTNAAEYVPKQLVKYVSSRQPASRPSPPPFQAETTSQTVYTPKVIQPACSAETLLTTKKWRARRHDNHWWFRETLKKRDNAAEEK
ncbi:unnamed protein product [Nippostrongylus brasiliensis]|uniref:Uncharacterized protein n=1 Tax=Nippostrongylus brasiliensis TaxID=27835 RepID=A0A0N4YVS9_NIPBR|nr:unnamed protein product [Nippostrongylus brasiliensis]